MARFFGKLIFHGFVSLIAGIALLLLLISRSGMDVPRQDEASDLDGTGQRDNTDTQE